jgi:hypothetical protein
MLPLLPIPQPFVHDEFSYLLGADTFASGRVTNPTPPMWQHFETFHVDMTPTYMSMYFPGAALAMAAGKVLLGDPWFGVLLCSACMCGSICWMLQGWLPPGWALFGASLAAIRLALFSYWTNSYYGGALASLGGALVLGALPRLKRRPTVRCGIVLCLGMLILANTRPYEGFVLCVGVCALLLAHFASRQVWAFARTMAIPAMLFLGGLSLLGWYNFRVYGSPVTLPYTVNRALYAKVPVFIWQKPKADPSYRHEIMRDFYLRAEPAEFNRASGFEGIGWSVVRKIGILLVFFVGAAMAPALFLSLRALRDRRLRPLMQIGSLYALGLAVNAWLFPHYAAPFAAGIWALLIQSLRHLRHCGSRRDFHGVTLVRLTGALCVLLSILRVSAVPLGLRIDRFPAMWYGTPALGLQRAAVLHDLASLPGPQLAIVRYVPGHPPFDDWVYNGADIDASKVVWARDMGEKKNQELLHYYAGRKAWLVEPDLNPVRISLLH